MALVKTIHAFSDTGLTMYGIIIRESDGYRLNDANGSFGAAPADYFLSLSEDSTVKGYYTVQESRTAWNDGTYIVLLYSQTGGSPSTSSDVILNSGTLEIKDDAELNYQSLSTQNQGNQVLTSTLKSRIAALGDDLESVLSNELGKIRPAISSLQQSLLRGRK